MDPNKEALPEERRQLNQIIFNDPLRARILFTPLLFQVGGAMAPESSAFIRDLAQAAAFFFFFFFAIE